MPAAHATIPPGTPAAPADDILAVELRAARLPIIGWLAWHHWFVIIREGRCDRWEVWQRPTAGGDAWGHLHCNLLPPERGVGNGPSWVVRSWSGADGRSIVQRVESAPGHYPFLHRYRYWPGPNSNTFAQWALGRHPLGRRGLGARYAHRGTAPVAPLICR